MKRELSTGTSAASATAGPGFIVLAAHFCPQLTPHLHGHYRRFRAQFLEHGIPLLTLAVGAHYEAWVREFPEVRVVEGDLLFQKERLWGVGARIAECVGYERFLCLDADVLFDGTDWHRRLAAAFRRYDVIQPFERVLHHFDDVVLTQRTTLGFPLRISARPVDARVARIHRSYQNLNGVRVVSLPLGTWTNRRYHERNQILRHFDPERDLSGDPDQGLRFTDTASELETEVGRFMRARLT